MPTPTEGKKGFNHPYAFRPVRLMRHNQGYFLNLKKNFFLKTEFQEWETMEAEPGLLSLYKRACVSNRNSILFIERCVVREAIHLSSFLLFFRPTVFFYFHLEQTATNQKNSLSNK